MNTITRVFIVTLATFGAVSVHAATECDSQAKPALSCPTGYSVMCIPVGTPHWGCGSEASGEIVEATLVKAVLPVEGRSIPENSIVVPVQSTITVRGDLVVESGSAVVGKPFILDGSKSQDDGVIHSFVWKQVSGPTAILSNTKALSLSVTPSVAGTYVFELVVTDATGLSSVAQRSTFTVDATGPTVMTKTPPPTGDPDFDLHKAAPAMPAIGDLDRDGAMDRVVPSVTPKDGVDHQSESDASAGKNVIPGDPDFDLLKVDVGSDDLVKFREEVASPERRPGVIVRGWDPEKKEEILAHPEAATTSEALKVYVEAVALNDPAITSITIKEGTTEIASEEDGKLLWFIPVTMTSRVTIDMNVRDSTSDPVSVRLPWWHIFVTGVSPRDLDTEITAVYDGAAWAKVDNSEPPTASARAALQLKAVSNVLKIRHDTAKNSIGNVR